MFLSPDSNERDIEYRPAWSDEMRYAPAKGANDRNQLLMYYWDGVQDPKHGMRWKQVIPKVKDKEGELHDAEEFLTYDMAYLEWFPDQTPESDCMVVRQYARNMHGNTEPAKYRGFPSSKLPINAEGHWEEIDR